VDEQKKHYSITEAAAIAQIGRDVLYRAIDHGAIKIWVPYEGGNPRIKKEDLERWMNNCRSNSVHVSVSA
jgi:excisionase family DNA binding protein